MQDVEREKKKLLRMFEAVYDLEERVISCDECGDQLGAYIDAGLGGQDLASQFSDVSQHLRHCPDCRREYLQAREILEMERQGELVEPPGYPAFDLAFLGRQAVAPAIPSPKPSWRWDELGRLIVELSEPFLRAFAPPPRFQPVYVTRAKAEPQKLLAQFALREPEIQDLGLEVTIYEAADDPQRCVILAQVEVPGRDWPDLAGVRVSLTVGEEVYTAETDEWGKISFEDVLVEDLAQATLQVGPTSS